LDLNEAKLNIFEADSPNNVVKCCEKMFTEWLRVDLHASWKKLFEAIDEIPSG